MYPSLPYPGYSWSMNHHMGVANERNLYALVWAAETFKRNRDPIQDIDSYLIANNILTTNVRGDTGQASPFRDYQQVPSELGLLVSRQFQEHITLTPIGLAFVENTISYEELMTLQVLRYQYPNGHRSSISPALRRQLAGTQYRNYQTLTELQATTGVQIRPGVLVWRVLLALHERGENPFLTNKEIQEFLVPCARHSDSQYAINALIAARRAGTAINTGVSRVIQEWFRFLLHSRIFAPGPRSTIRISDFGLEHAEEIDEICEQLEKPETFWIPSSENDFGNLSWHMHFGSIDLSINLLIEPTMDGLPVEENDRDGADDERGLGVKAQNINLRPFDPDNLLEDNDTREDGAINNQIITYEASLSRGKHILHDNMIILIADICRRNGGDVFDDPQSVDLLVGFQNQEFIVEVKSVTSRNFVQRLRLALGQLLHYDYLRSSQSQTPRRKVIAVTAHVPSNSWCIPFLNGYLDVDLLSLGNQGLNIRSNFELSNRLFRITDLQTSLFEGVAQ